MRASEASLYRNKKRSIERRLGKGETYHAAQWPHLLIAWNAFVARSENRTGGY